MITENFSCDDLRKAFRPSLSADMLGTPVWLDFVTPDTYWYCLDNSQVCVRFAIG